MTIHHEILKKFYWRLSKRKCLSIMTVVHDGLSRERLYVVEVCSWTLGKDFKTLRNRVSDKYDGFVGQIVEIRTVCRSGPLLDT